MEFELIESPNALRTVIATDDNGEQWWVQFSPESVAAGIPVFERRGSLIGDEERAEAEGGWDSWADSPLPASLTIPPIGIKASVVVQYEGYLPSFTVQGFVGEELVYEGAELTRAEMELATLDAADMVRYRMNEHKA